MTHFADRVSNWSLQVIVGQGWSEVVVSDQARLSHHGVKGNKTGP